MAPGEKTHRPAARPVALAEGDTLVLYAAVAVRFNPGSSVPFALGAFRRNDGSLCLARILHADLTPCTDVAPLIRDKTALRVKMVEEKPLAVLP